MHVSVIYFHCYREKNSRGDTVNNPCDNKTESACTVEVLHVRSAYGLGYDCYSTGRSSGLLF